ncbi:hypothetical protein [Deinococcus marmoris]|uniref:hypothetical protein n=1 Tax=Deinococcus marmoris TaxID=249408 RepID=UPI0012DE0CAD|nr:hypothetical protein [Deinococcus marmoris]
MQFYRVPPLMVLAPISAARSTAPTNRNVDVVLGQISLAYTATSPLALPHGADLRVLFALMTHAADDGQVQVSIPTLLRTADMGTGGRQHGALFSALDRLRDVTYMVQRAPQVLGLPNQFKLVSWAGLAPGGQLHVELSPGLAVQMRGCRAHPAPRQTLNIPGNALVLYSLLEVLRTLPEGMDTGQWRLPVDATCELLGLPGRGDNARRSLMSMGAALKTSGSIAKVQVIGRGNSTQLVIDDRGPDATVMALP